MVILTIIGLILGSTTQSSSAQSNLTLSEILIDKKNPSDINSPELQKK